jgi:hypothetical protein
MEMREMMQNKGEAAKEKSEMKGNFKIIIIHIVTGIRKGSKIVFLKLF